MAMLGVLALGGGCGSGSTNGPAIDPGAWSYPERQYVLNELTLPFTAAQARDFGFDLDGDGQPNNVLGELLSGVRSMFTDPQGVVDQVMNEGRIIQLFSLYAQGVAASPTAILWTFLGEPRALTVGPQPGDSFTLDATAGQDLYLGGAIRGGGGSFGDDAATATVVIPLTSTTMVTLTLHRARVELDLGAGGETLESGRLGGAVLLSDVQQQIVPLLDGEMVKSCTARTTGGDPPNCGCAADSGAETIRTVFDRDGDCVISAAEVQENTLAQSLLTPDVTLPAGPGVSVGLGFTAVRAVFDHPAPPARE
jgi:hypothetical protein